MKKLFVILLLLSACLPAYADHIFGGYIGFKTHDPSKGQYFFSLRLYVDITTAPVNYDYSMKNYAVPLKIFRKSDNKEMDGVFVTFRKNQDVAFENIACANLRKFSIQVYDYHFEANILNPDDYTDPEGYYVVYDRCCRNKTLDNIVDPGNEAMIFYTEFPPLKVNGKLTQYATPDFPILNGDYICRNKRFEYTFKATDDDADEMKYSVMTPLKGMSTQDAAGLKPEPAPYKTVTWSSGYSSASPFGGSQPLSMNSKTGVMSLKTNNDGLFLFCVVIEDYRSGKKMGQVRHDFQLPVVSCSTNPTPVTDIKYKGNLVSEVEFCPGEQVPLTIDIVSVYHYQWQLDGFSIPGANGATFLATEPGEYRVFKSLKSYCGSDTTSQIVNLKTAVPKPKIRSDKPGMCNFDNVTLSVDPLAGFVFDWVYEKAAFGQGDKITVNKPGWYYAIAAKTGTGCKAEKDSILISNSLTTPLPDPKTSYPGCIGDVIELETTNSPDYTYSWKKEDVILPASNTSKLKTTESGDYRVEVTDKNGCIETSNPYKVIIESKPAIRFDSLDPVCQSNAKKLILYATPPNGKFDGMFVQNNEFDPYAAGIGRHPVTYTYTLPSGCKNEVRRIVEVYKPFDLTITPKEKTIRKNEPVQITSLSNAPGLYFHWHPDDFLDDHNAPNPIVTPEHSITYYLTAINTDGCTMKEEVKIIVDNNGAEPVYMPTAFTPNYDGENDELEVFTYYPDKILMRVYDHWGNVIFEQNENSPKWNGGYKNNLSNPLPTGTYVVILTFRNFNGESVRKTFEVNLLR
ncbi:T9SS type B sorting domain-containing protein [Emticicia sp. CRIBPO]|uniref:T9SS type B sorting domain-containing protein n=1 Tax=Emticicia sp. CRIBPO TaxID=2683258 RepID=UPI0014137402|nr:gliding motility-associated C-terminal domain-containing protein [Emticicia sp. CRIBPO]NBA87974.1 T9SS type B sorting domain-containing protein [Emticicia sp. CRIBPO]